MCVAESRPRNPITGTFGCCAGAASGKPTTAPPRSEMKLRRVIVSPGTQEQGTVAGQVSTLEVVMFEFRQARSSCQTDVAGGSLSASPPYRRRGRNTPEGRRAVTRPGWPRRAMYGRRPRCKKNLTFPRSVRVQPCVRPVFAWRADLHCDAAAVAAGPDVIR